MKVMKVPLTARLCFSLTALASVPAEALNSVGTPVLATDVGFYCSATYATHGATLTWGDTNSNPCQGATGITGVTKISTGMYSTKSTNIAEAWCAPNYYWIYEGTGDSPINAVYHDAFNTQTGGDCYFKVTIGNSLRQPISTAGLPLPFKLAPVTRLPRPAADPNYTFDYSQFASSLETALENPGSPFFKPAGFQVAIRDPNGKLVYSNAKGKAVTQATAAAYGLLVSDMSKTRRLDMASASKTLTATAMVAAIEDLGPGLNITLDSSIYPYLPSNWDRSKVKDTTFRMVLEHRTGLKAAKDHDSYEGVGNSIALGVDPVKQGVWSYNDVNYALLRILIAYVVDGPQAYKPFESDAPKNGLITALSYRNYVRGRLLARIGLSAVDDFYAYTGPTPETTPETIYYDGKTNPLQVIGDKVNIDNPNHNCYDETATHMVVTAGSGNWTMSAEEMSLFISSLWQGKIVSTSSLDQMVAGRDNMAFQVGSGNYGSTLALPDGLSHTDLNENGNGSCDGTTAQWVTFFNGYTAVYLSNTGSPVGIGQIDQMAAKTIVRN
jgi:hypothetical protein